MGRIFRITCWSAFICTAVLVNSKPNGCNENEFTNLKSCCKTQQMLPDKLDFSDCAQLESFPACERDICIAKKLSILDSEGDKLEKKLAIKFINIQYEDTPEVAETLATRCVRAPTTSATAHCEVTQFFNCLLLFGCTDWDSSESCDVMKKSVETCY